MCSLVQAADNCQIASDLKNPARYSDLAENGIVWN